MIKNTTGLLVRVLWQSMPFKVHQHPMNSL